MSYSFLKESKLYIEHGGNKYRIHTNATVSFSQTFAEDSYPVKTLHDQTKMFEGTTINKANPAAFSFAIPLTVEKDESIVMDLISDMVTEVDSNITTQQLKSFHLYVQTGSSTFKINNCIIETAQFAFNPREQFRVEIAGTGTKLERLGNGSYNLGTIQSESSTRTPLLVYPSVSIDSLDMSSIVGLTLSISNNIEWSPYLTLQDSLSVTNSSNAMFPSAYTIQNRIISGEIRQYQTDDNITQFDDFSTNSNINIKAIQVGKPTSDSGFWAIQLNPSMYTARMAVAPVYVQSYDFRTTDNTAVGTRITQYS